MKKCVYKDTKKWTPLIQLSSCNRLGRDIQMECFDCQTNTGGPQSSNQTKIGSYSGAVLFITCDSFCHVLCRNYDSFPTLSPTVPPLPLTQ